MTIYQVFGLFIAIWIAWWTIKKLLTHYTVIGIVKYRVCMPCLANKITPRIVLHSEWDVLTPDGPVAICDSCRQRIFPHVLAETAQEMKLLVKVPNDNADKTSV